MLAKLTHKIYGINNQLATLEIPKNLIIVSKIKIHKTIMTINPKNGDFNPKNATDQKILTNNWIMNIITALFIFFLSNSSAVLAKRDQIKNTAIPIRANKIVQTGAKTQLGGLKDGLLMV